MPSVNDSADLVEIVSFLQGDNPQGTNFSGVLFVDEFTSPQWGADRARTYRGPRPAVLADMEADGFLEGSPLWIAVSQALLQTSAPDRIHIGRKDPTDLTWGDAMDAIFVGFGEGYFIYWPTVTSNADIIDVATWCTQSTQMVLGFAVTSNADVLGDIAGNLGEQLQALITADNGGRFVLGYHDPIKASGAKRPVVSIPIPVSGRFSGTPGGTLNLRVTEGAEQVFTLTAARAKVVSTNAGPYALTSGQNLDVAFEGVPTSLVISAAPAEIVSLPETYDISGAIGGSVVIVTDSGTDSYTISALSYVDDTAATAEEVRDEFLAGIATAVGIATSVGGQVQFKSATIGFGATLRFTAGTHPDFLKALGLTTDAVQGSGNVANQAAVPTAELANLVTSLSGSAGSAFDEAGDLALQGSIYGTDSTVEVLGTSTAGLLTEVGLTAAVTAGTGVVGNAASIAPASLFTALQTAFPTSTAISLTSTAITIEGTTGVGFYHTLRFYGSLRSGLGLPNTLIRGVGVHNDHIMAATIGARAGISIDERGLTKWDGAFLANCFGDDLPLNVSRRLREEQNVNTFEHRSRNDPRPQFRDGTLIANLSPTGEKVYIDSRIGIDWFAVRLQEAVLNANDLLDNAGTSILYSFDQVQTFIVSTLEPVGVLGVQRRVLESWDSTPPNPEEGKRYGVTVALRSELSSADKNLRRWRVESSQPGSGFVQRFVITNKMKNA